MTTGKKVRPRIENGKCPGNVTLYFVASAAEKSLIQKTRAWLTFVIIGGGPTGVELAGAIAELAYNTLKMIPQD